jgi:hypothetical protein
MTDEPRQPPPEIADKVVPFDCRPPVFADSAAKYQLSNPFHRNTLPASRAMDPNHADYSSKSLMVPPGVIRVVVNIDNSIAI